MKRTWLVCFVAWLALASAAWSQTNKSSGDAEKAVAAQEQKWLESQKANKPEMLESLLADKFVNTNSEGQVSDKAAMIAREKKTKYTSVEYGSLKVIGYGDAAVAIGVLKGKGTDAKGKPMDFTEQFTDTWVKMPNGQWQCVASHGSNLKK